jgi:mRNA interferase RelE/StbE
VRRLWTVIVLHSVEKKISTLQKIERERIQSAINELANGPYVEGLDIKPLKARPEWRLRVGDWRILFKVDNERITITVVRLAPRGNVYKG